MRTERATGLPALALALLALMPPPAVAATDLERWLGDELAPALGGTLASHPRFRGAPVRIVVLEQDRPAARSDALTAALAQRLTALLAARDGVVLAEARPETPAPSDPRACLPAPEDYWLTLEAMVAPPGEAAYRVRALDRRDQAWVPGLLHRWQGRLSAAERALKLREVEDEAQRGSRELPFGPGQEDLAAARIAGELACRLRAHPAERPATLVADEDGTGRLAAQYLAGAGLISLAPGSGARLALAVSRLPVTDGLEQVWVALSPVVADEALPEVRAMVYVEGGGGPGPGPAAAGAPVPPAPAPLAVAAAPPPRSAAPAVAPLALLFLSDGCRPGRCDGPARMLHPAAPLPGAGLALALRATPGARVYVWQAAGGRLLALGPGRCGAGAHAVPATGSLRVPLEARPDLSGLAALAIAAGDPRAAVLERPGASCGGLQGAGLDAWLDELAAAGLGPAAGEGWQALAVAGPAQRLARAAGGTP